MAKTIFLCDRCGQPISDGALRIAYNDSVLKIGTFKNFRIECADCVAVESEMENKNSIRKNGLLNDHSFSGFGDQNELMFLLECLSNSSYETKKDKETILLLIRRMFVPLFEENYRYIDEALLNGVFEENTKHFYPSSDQLIQIDSWRKKRV